MNTFVITWTGGKQEVVTQADAATIEEFANIHFGSAWETAQESGVTIEQVPDDQEEAMVAHCAERGILGGMIQPEFEEAPVEELQGTPTTINPDALTTEGVPVLTTEQLTALTTQDVSVLTTEQVAALTTDQI